MSVKPRAVGLFFGGIDMIGIGTRNLIGQHLSIAGGSARRMHLPLFQQRLVQIIPRPDQQRQPIAHHPLDEGYFALRLAGEGVGG